MNQLKYKSLQTRKSFMHCSYGAAYDPIYDAIYGIRFIFTFDEEAGASKASGQLYAAHLLRKLALFKGQHSDKIFEIVVTKA